MCLCTPHDKKQGKITLCILISIRVKDTIWTFKAECSELFSIPKTQLWSSLGIWNHNFVVSFLNEEFYLIYTYCHSKPNLYVNQ